MLRRNFGVEIEKIVATAIQDEAIVAGYEYLSKDSRMKLHNLGNSIILSRGVNNENVVPYMDEAFLYGIVADLAHALVTYKENLAETDGSCCYFCTETRYGILFEEMIPNRDLIIMLNFLYEHENICEKVSNIVRDIYSRLCNNIAIDFLRRSHSNELSAGIGVAYVEHLISAISAYREDGDSFTITSCAGNFYK